MATDSMDDDGAIQWEDRDCGYREVTTHDERYDDALKKFVPMEMKVLRFHKPRPPLPAHQQPAYLRYGLHKPEPVEVEQGQQTLGSTA